MVRDKCLVSQRRGIDDKPVKLFRTTAAEQKIRCVKHTFMLISIKVNRYIRANTYALIGRVV
jgi:hypothetical protein